MKCPQCQYENLPRSKFCVECGVQLGIACPQCRIMNVTGSKFCGECGQALQVDPSGTKPSPSAGSAAATEEQAPRFEGERKHITVLFSDLTGYTTISERLDPEEVKDLMNRLFKEIFKIVGEYEGFVERVIGDGIMILFGIPVSHEDDAVRAIMAAMDIHAAVDRLSKVFENKIGHRICMHSGINTGLVVTGHVDLEKGHPGVAGDSVNIASRLSDLAKAGEILAGPNTYPQAIRHFDFEKGPLTKVKGKTEAVQVYKVLGPKRKPLTTYFRLGLRSDIIGRKAELAQIKQAYERLKIGKGTIFTIHGDAGTGKSRLILEFKSNLDLARNQWVEGHAYPYTKKIPFFPLMDLLRRVMGIDEADSADTIREKIDKGVIRLVGRRKTVAPYIGSLYNLAYPELDGISPGIWNRRLYEATYDIILALSRRAPTVFCIEDLHWADGATLDLLKKISANFRTPTILITTHRPPFSLFTNHQMRTLGELHHEIQVKELSPSESRDMMESMLDTEEIPLELQQFVRDKAQGNPFYLEEVINSLIEAGILAFREGAWQITRPFDQSEIPPTVHGVIAARLDRLEPCSKRILQEASVIGRAFLFDILKKITTHDHELDGRFSDLERIDLIRTRSLAPDLEFIFKHALTQEVGYNSLLKKERREIHERIGRVMEKLFGDRLTEFYETLALHFRHGKSVSKAVFYLTKSGEKSLKRYALEESQQYFETAYELIGSQPLDGQRNKELLIDVIIQWSFVYYYRGHNRELLQLLRSHQTTAESLDDRSRTSMFYAWLGCAFWHRGRFNDSRRHLKRALTLGEESGNYQAIAYACSWLSWIYSELGRTEDAIAHAERVQDLVMKDRIQDHYVYFNSLGGKGYAHWHRGESQKAAKVGRELLNFASKHSNVRAMVLGQCSIGWSHLITGDMTMAKKHFEQATQISSDPWYAMFPKLALCYGYVATGMVAEATRHVTELQRFSQRAGAEFLGDSADFIQGLLQASKGQLGEGFATMEGWLEKWDQRGNRLRFVCLGHIIGEAYLQVYLKGAEMSPEVPAEKRDRMGEKALQWLTRAMAAASETGAHQIVGQTQKALARLHQSRGETVVASQYYDKAIAAFNRCQAHIYRQEAQEALAALDKSRP